ncbi:MAG TPA: CmcI family methyltransferase [Verrucomicrobiae bacterium]
MRKVKKLNVDLEAGEVSAETSEGRVQAKIDSAEGFDLISQTWLRAGWDTKYVYSFSWLGRPIIQLPDDMMRIQEIVFDVKPDVIVETGVAHGGSLIFYASLCKAMGKGRVVGIDIEIRPHNRLAIESHFLAPYITLVEGSSIDAKTVNAVQRQIKPGETVLVCLDSCHTKEHTLAELNAYSSFVTPGSYIVAMDGIMEWVEGAPRTNPDWHWNNPRQAALEFAKNHPDFVHGEPKFLFNEGKVTNRVTYWPDAFLKRRA